MKLMFDSLKYVKMLRRLGCDNQLAENLIQALMALDIQNVYSKEEISTMLSKDLEKILVNQEKRLTEQRREFNARSKERRQELDKRLAEQRREFEVHSKERRQELDKRLAEQRCEFEARSKERRQEFDNRLATMQKQNNQNLGEARTARRWLASLIISCTLTIIGYLHFIH